MQDLAPFTRELLGAIKGDSFAAYFLIFSTYFKFYWKPCTLTSCEYIYSYQNRKVVWRRYVMISLGNPIYVDLDISIRYVVCCSINNSDLAWHWVNSAFVLYLEGSHVKSLELQRRVSVLCSYLCCKFVCLFSFFISFYRKNVPSLEDHMFQVNRITETCTSVICSYLCCKFHSVFLDKISFFLSLFLWKELFHL